MIVPTLRARVAEAKHSEKSGSKARRTRLALSKAGAGGSMWSRVAAVARAVYKIDARREAAERHHEQHHADAQDVTPE